MGHASQPESSVIGKHCSAHMHEDSNPVTLSPGKRGSSLKLGEGLIAQNTARFQAMMQHERTGNRARICQSLLIVLC